MKMGEMNCFSLFCKSYLVTFELSLTLRFYAAPPQI